MLSPGQRAPAFELPDASGAPVRLDDFRGSHLVLYFYARDNTSGCTREALDFSTARPDFAALNARVVGISPDPVARHSAFSRKHALELVLLADPEHRVIEVYGAWQARTLYGRPSMGVVRSTYLINPQGLITQVWPRVKVDGHAAAVLAELRRKA